jgi:hypothetical protein
VYDFELVGRNTNVRKKGAMNLNTLLLVLPALFTYSFYSSSQEVGYGIVVPSVNKTKDEYKINFESMGNVEESSVHKVWKYKAFNRLPHLSKDGSGIFGIEAFATLDLTSRDTARYTTNADSTLEISPYRIVDNTILIGKYSDQIKYRISKLTENELILTVRFDYEQGDTKLHGDLVELVYEVSTKKE